MKRTDRPRPKFYTALAFLQNAWSPMYAGEEWPRGLWLRALHRSRTGQRLQVLQSACPQLEIRYYNTTPICGETPSSRLPPDLGYMQNQIHSEPNPQVLIGFGRQACESVVQLGGGAFWPCLLLPHPAYRVLTNTLLEQAGALLARGFWGSIELTQERGKVREHRQLLPKLKATDG